MRIVIRISLDNIAGCVSGIAVHDYMLDAIAILIDYCLEAIFDISLAIVHRSYNADRGHITNKQFPAGSRKRC